MGSSIPFRIARAWGRHLLVLAKGDTSVGQRPAEIAVRGRFLHAVSLGRLGSSAALRRPVA